MVVDGGDDDDLGAGGDDQADGAGAEEEEGGEDFLSTSGVENSSSVYLPVNHDIRLFR